MTTKRMILAIAAFAAISLFAASAQADGYGCYYGYGRYSANLTPLYSSGQIHTPPYFSLHPPVYYSRPVARTYGYSPWAYPPETMTPGAPRRVGSVTANPYVSQEATAAGVAAVGPWVKNPHVTSVAETAMAAEVVAER